MTKEPTDQQNATNDVVVAGSGQVVPARQMCTCCNPPKPLAMGENNIPFAMCVAGNKVYQRNDDGIYVVTDYVYRGAKIVDPAGGRTIYPPDNSTSAPSSDELLRSLRGSESPEGEEGAGDQKPSTQSRERVNLGDAEYY